MLEVDSIHVSEEIGWNVDCHKEMCLRSKQKRVVAPIFIWRQSRGDCSFHASTTFAMGQTWSRRNLPFAKAFVIAN